MSVHNEPGKPGSFDSGPWQNNEINALICLYQAMLNAQFEGKKYTKRHMIIAVQALGLNRSRGSIEAKLMNMTAAVESIGRPDLSMSDHGYRPLSNMQKELKRLVTLWAAEIKSLPAYPHEQERAS